MATTVDLTRLRNPVAPRLPAATVEWDHRFMEQYSNALRLYFNGIDTTFGGLLGSPKTGTTTPPGGSFLNFPHGSFYDTTDQTAVSTTAAYPITFNTTDLSNNVSVVSNSRITFATTGVYNVQFSVQLSNDNNAPQDIDIWFRQNGTDIPQSNSRFGLAARKSAGDPYHTVATINLLVTVDANDYVEIVWCTTNVAARIEAYVAGTSPTRPAIPSAILTAAFVSSVPT